MTSSNSENEPHSLNDLEGIKENDISMKTIQGHASKKSSTDSSSEDWC